jgi:hypothetical protein
VSDIVEDIMEDKLQIVRRWARRGNLKQFLTDMQPRIAPLGYTAEMSIDTIKCYRLVEKKRLMGLRRQYLKEPVASIRRRNGSIEFEGLDEEFADVLASVAQVD